MSVGGKCIVKMIVFFNEIILLEVVICFCICVLLRYGVML